MINESELKYECYNSKAESVDHSDEDMVAFKRTQVLSGYDRYYIRSNLEYRIYNPFSKAYLDRSSMIAKNKGMKEIYKFVQVSEEGFKIYLSFLRNKNYALIPSVERTIK